MAGMLLQGGARALVGSGMAAQPPLTQAPSAATSAASASEVAFGPSATNVRPAGAKGAWLTPGPHHVVTVGAVALVGLVLLYRSLPR